MFAGIKNYVWDNSLYLPWKYIIRNLLQMVQFRGAISYGHARAADT